MSETGRSRLPTQDFGWSTSGSSPPSAASASGTGSSAGWPKCGAAAIQAATPRAT